MEENSKQYAETAIPQVEAETVDLEERDPESNSLTRPLLKRNRTLSSSPLAIVGTKVSHIESLDYEINENDLFKHDWRSRSRAQVLQYVFLKWTLACLVGLLTGIIATLINLAVENIAGYKLLAVVAYIEQERYITGLIYFTAVNFLLTSVAAVLCVFFAPTAAGPGIPEIKAYLNGVDTPDMFGATTLIVKIIGSIGAVSAGLDLGKEGPLVHIGSCIASLLGQGGPDNHRIKWRWLRYFNNDRDRRDLITCGASSGVCAAFRAPVGGVLFALEEVATWWRSALLWRTFFSTAVVVVVLRAFIEICNNGQCGLFGRGGLIMFDVSNVSVRYRAMDIIPVVLIGIIGGLLGSLYNHVLHKVLRLYNLINQKGKIHKLLLSLFVSIFTSVCLYGLPFLASCTPCDNSLPDSACPTNGRSGNYKQFNCPKGYYNDLATLLLTTNDDAVRNIFSTNTAGEYNPVSLLIFFAIYCILGLITFGIAVPSGLFLPIILMGSAYGRLLGLAMKSYTNIDQGLYAVLGAASLMAGSMRMTVSLCVIFLELTNNLLLLPITMMVLLIAKTVGDSFNPSIYEIILELKGLPFLDANPEPWMRNLTVAELADAKPPVVTLHGVEKVSRVVEVLKNTTHNGFPVVDDGVVPPVGLPIEATELHGLILRTHLVQVLKKKWFLSEKRRTEEWEVREKFTSVDLAEREGTIEEVVVTRDEMDMYIDLHPLTNTTPYTVVESMSVAKAMVLFRAVGLRHMLIVPKYEAAGVPPIVGILTRQDLRAHNILSAFPHLARSKSREKGH
ncbi:Chloride channel protein CLC-b [Morus notabilis]|uniref:Chloride channel protein n=1 Tax=Morus notabilis TaxID=981085 RepID=W9S8G0_9ROSA|nr:chloride channel protein CLC-a isoform X1 [Morus notabilis]EXC31330.1 Chloride channel protein CLC-b [Morus notabilis]